MTAAVIVTFYMSVFPSRVPGGFYARFDASNARVHNFGRECQVSRYNIEKLRKVVRNGPEVHPGANQVNEPVRGAFLSFEKSGGGTLRTGKKGTNATHWLIGCGWLRVKIRVSCIRLVHGNPPPFYRR